MMFWITCAVLTVAAFVAAIFPFLRTKTVDPDAGPTDIVVYKDQLSEIDSDLARGLISQEDAANARIEVSRRLLKADEAKRAVTAKGSAAAGIVAGMALLSIPLISWGGYIAFGSPDMPDMPVAQRASAKEPMPEIAGLLQKAEDHLKANPSDGRGWTVIAPIYMRLGRFADAVVAYENAIANSQPSAMLQLGLGEALAAGQNGRIDEAALAAFKKAAQIEPDNPEPKALVATALAQQGKFAEAKSEFEKLLAAAPANAPWRPSLEAALRDIEKAMNPDAANPDGSTAPKGPTQADVENAANMSDADRKAMIEGMVANLDAKLEQNPNDPAGWVRLIRSYAMLQDKEKTGDALQRARTALASDQAALDQLKTIAVELGLEQQ